MKIIAKFRCYDVSEFPNGNKNISMGAVYGTEGENADFAKATPNGYLNFSVDKDTKASTEFVRGEDYYLTFEKVEKK
jgi:hypothetical protein